MSLKPVKAIDPNAPGKPDKRTRSGFGSDHIKTSHQTKRHTKKAIEPVSRQQGDFCAAPSVLMCLGERVRVVVVQQVSVALAKTVGFFIRADWKGSFIYIERIGPGKDGVGLTH